MAEKPGIYPIIVAASGLTILGAGISQNNITHIALGSVLLNQANLLKNSDS